jgi:hypothetical protein
VDGSTEATNMKRGVDATLAHECLADDLADTSEEFMREEEFIKDVN